MDLKTLATIAFSSFLLFSNNSQASLLYGFENGTSELLFEGTGYGNRHHTGDLSGITATEGQLFAYISTGPDPEDDDEMSPDNETMTFTFSGAGVSTLSFDLDVLTSEITAGDNDYFNISLDGDVFFAGVIGEGYFMENNFNNTTGDPNGIRAPDGSVFTDGNTGWMSVSTTQDFSGRHTLSFFVSDNLYSNKDTALLVDNIRLTGQDPVPEPSTILLFGTGLVGLIGTARRQKKK